MKRLTCCLFALAWCFVSLSAQDDLDFTEMSLEDLLNVEISAASKSKESVIDAPSSVTVFTADDIRQMGVKDLETLLNYVPGYQATRDVAQGNGYRVASRGWGNVFTGSHLFLINGVRLNDLYTGNPININRFISVENIKQVEIIRGPGSALYGSNAFVGLVNIVTKDDANEAWIRGGEVGQREAGINFSMEADGVTYSGFVRAYSTDGERFDVPVDAFGGSGETRDPASGIDFTTMIRYKNFTAAIRHTERNFDDFLIFGVLNDNHNSEVYKQSSISLKFESKPNDNLEIDYGAYYSQDHLDQLGVAIKRDIEIFPGFALDNDLIGGPFIESYIGGATFDARWKLSENNNLSFGASYETTAYRDAKAQFNHNPINFFEYLGQIFRSGERGLPDFTDVDADRNIVGVYLQDKISFGEVADLTIGGRFDDYSDFGNTFNPRAAVIFNINEDSRFKVMYGEAFRAPNFLELYDRNNPVDFGNPNLDAETITTLEAAYVLAKPVNLSVTYFQNELEDIIVLPPDNVIVDDNNPLFAPGFVNGGSVDTEGVELEFRAFFAQGFMFRMTYTHMLELENLPFPENTGSFILNYGNEKVNFNLNGIYRDEIVGFDQSSYFVGNLAFEYKLTSTLAADIHIENAFDEEYVTPSDPLPLGLPNGGRLWRIGLSYHAK